jgi:ABC-2 type transport system permease protein
MWSICKKELRQFFSNLTGYIAIILFLLVNGLFLFVLNDSNIFDFGYATLNKFFELAPWILLFLIPAITMRTLSDEFKGGTFEILQTKPLTRWQIVLGKYVSILIVLVFVIVPTFIYVFTIQKLSVQGGIDTSISLCCSGFTSNAVVAFLISAFACLVLFFGFSALSKLPFFTNGLDYYIEMLGIDFHYRSISRGVLDSRDLLYFASIIFLFLLITVKNLHKK